MKIEDERVPKFIKIMKEEYGWEFTEEEAEEIYEVVDRVERELSE